MDLGHPARISWQTSSSAETSICMLASRRTVMTASPAYDIGSHHYRRSRHHTIHTYDASLRISKITDALSGVTRFTYDAANDRISVTNAQGETTTFAYDARAISPALLIHSRTRFSSPTTAG